MARHELGLAVLLLGLSVSAPAQEPDLRPLARQARESVVLLEVYDAAGRELGIGSGFFVTEDVIVSNHHVVAGARRVRAVPAEGEPFELLGELASDQQGDLVLLLAERRSGRPLELARREAEQGERIVVFGNPLGLEGTLSSGYVTAVRGPDPERRSEPSAPRLQIDAPISPGSSGSPVLNLRGQVVGVAVSQYRFGQNLNFAVPVREVWRLLDAAGDEPVLRYRGATRGSSLIGMAVSAGVSLLVFGLLWLALQGRLRLPLRRRPRSPWE